MVRVNVNLSFAEGDVDDVKYKVKISGAKIDSTGEYLLSELVAMGKQFGTTFDIINNIVVKDQFITIASKITNENVGYTNKIKHELSELFLKLCNIQ